MDNQFMKRYWQLAARNWQFADIARKKTITKK
jgi:hypothetical protein